jgi:phage-related holin
MKYKMMYLILMLLLEVTGYILAFVWFSWKLAVILLVLQFADNIYDLIKKWKLQ